MTVSLIPLSCMAGEMGGGKKKVGAHFFALAEVLISSPAEDCTPNSFARVTKDMPPRTLLKDRKAELYSLNRPFGITGCNTCVTRPANTASDRVPYEVAYSR